MKKIMESKIMLIVVTVLLSTTINAIANTIISSTSVNYTNSKTEETTVNGALDELFDTVDINERLGTTDISSIGDGTVTGAINKMNGDSIKIKRVRLSTETSTPVYADYITQYQGTITNVANAIKAQLPEGSTILDIAIIGCIWNQAHSITGLANYVSTYDNIYLQTSKPGLYLVDILVLYK